MSILIKGMRMPKDDVHAFKRITITNNWIDGEVIMLAHDTITNEFIGEVVEVQEPHGRLIDADVLCERLMANWITADENGKQIIPEVMADVVTPIVVGTPTVIEAESE